MEMFDIYNEDGTPAGYSINRDVAHQKGLWHKTVHIWIINRSGKVLLQKRAMNKETFPGFWDISCAGHVDSGESLETAALRELYEELGLVVKITDLNHIFTIHQKYYKESPLVIDNEITSVFLLKKELDIESVNYNKDEVTGLKFVEVEELISGTVSDIARHDNEYAKLLEYINQEK